MLAEGVQIVFTVFEDVDNDLVGQISDFLFLVAEESMGLLEDESEVGISRVEYLVTHGLAHHVQTETHDLLVPA